MKKNKKITKNKQPIKEFDDVNFENLFEKIIIDEKDTNGNINPNMLMNLIY